MNDTTNTMDLERRTWRGRIRMAWVLVASLALLQLAICLLLGYSVLTDKAAVFLSVLPLVVSMGWMDVVLITAFMGLKVLGDSWGSNLPS